MDTRIETFLNLYQTMNYHETARQLNMTQPAVTQHIKSLEAEYGCRFFLYNHKVLSKTKEAEIFESFARSIIYNIDELRTCLKKPKIRCARIGATKSIGEFMLADILSRYLTDTSRTVEITVDNTEHLLKMLDGNRIDFALIEGEFNKSRYASSLFREEPFCGICAATHDFTNRTVSPEELFRETLILRESGSGTRSIFCDLLNNLGYSIESFSRIATVSEFSLLTALVANGSGISFVYQAVADHAPGVSTFSLKGINPAHELNYVYLKNTVAESLVTEFSRSVR